MNLRVHPRPPISELDSWILGVAEAHCVAEPVVIVLRHLDRLIEIMEPLLASGVMMLDSSLENAMGWKKRVINQLRML